jgi:hypothetical protein
MNPVFHALVLPLCTPYKRYSAAFIQVPVEQGSAAFSNIGENKGSFSFICRRVTFVVREHIVKLR